MVPKSFCSIVKLFYFKFHRFLPIFYPSKYDLLCICLKVQIVRANLNNKSLEYNKFEETKHGQRALEVLLSIHQMVVFDVVLI